MPGTCPLFSRLPCTSHPLSLPPRRGRIVTPPVWDAKPPSLSRGLTYHVTGSIKHGKLHTNYYSAAIFKLFITFKCNLENFTGFSSPDGIQGGDSEVVHFVEVNFV